MGPEREDDSPVRGEKLRTNEDRGCLATDIPYIIGRTAACAVMAMGVDGKTMESRLRSILRVLCLLGALLPLWLEALPTSFSYSLTEPVNDLRSQVRLCLDNKQDSLALSLLDQIPAALAVPSDRVLRIHAHAGLRNWAGVASTVESAPRSFHERFFTDCAVEYIQSAVRLNRLDALRSFLSHNRMHLSPRENMRLHQVILALYREGDWNLVPLLLDILPPDTFTDDEKRLLKGVSAYYCGNYPVAEAELDSLPETSSLLTIAAEYRILSAFASRDSLNAQGLPLTGTAYANLLIHLMNRGETDTAATLTLNAPPSFETGLVRVMLEADAGRYKTAAVLLNELDPERVHSCLPALMAESLILTRTGQSDSAITTCHEAKNLYLLQRTRYGEMEIDQWLNFTLAELHRGRGEFDSALHFMRLNRTVIPSLYDSLAIFNIASVEFGRNHLSLAIAEYDSLFAKYPASITPENLNLFAGLLMKSHYYTLLDRYLEAFGNRFSKDDRERYSVELGNHFYDQKNYRQARIAYERIPTASRSDEVVYRIERIKWNNRPNEDLEEFYRGFVLKYPHNRHSRKMVYDLARLYQGQQRYRDLVEFTGQAMRLSGLRVNADSLQYFRAIGFQGTGETGNAVRVYRQLIRNGKSRPLRQQAVIDLSSLLSRGNPLTAINTLNGIIDSLRDHSMTPFLFVSLGDIYQKQRMYSHAAEYYRLVLAEGGFRDSLDVYYRLARVTQSLRQYEESAMCLDVLDHFPKDSRYPDVLWMKFEVHRDLHDEGEARRALLRLLRDFPGDRRRTEAFAELTRSYYRMGRWADAWYFLQRFRPAADAYSKYRLENDVPLLREHVGRDSVRVRLAPDYFRGILEQEGMDES
jgi:tetratricopeptide (TPR) repeat protein